MIICLILASLKCLAVVSTQLEYLERFYGGNAPISESICYIWTANTLSIPAAWDFWSSVIWIGLRIEKGISLGRFMTKPSPNFMCGAFIFLMALFITADLAMWRVSKYTVCSYFIIIWSLHSIFARTEDKISQNCTVLAIYLAIMVVYIKMVAIMMHFLTPRKSPFSNVRNSELSPKI